MGSENGEASNDRTRLNSQRSKGEDNLYEVLGLEKQCTPDDIKKAYRRLALRYHPDKNAGDEAMAEKFKQVNHANTVLSNPVRRRIYDELGAMGLQMADTIGDENVAQLFLLRSKWMKCCVFFTCLFTGCCCCCCCCACCNFCCGKCKPKDMSDFEYHDDEAHNWDERGDGAANGSSEPVVTDQPSSGGPIPMPPPGDAIPMPPPGAAIPMPPPGEAIPMQPPSYDTISKPNGSDDTTTVGADTTAVIVDFDETSQLPDTTSPLTSPKKERPDYGATSQLADLVDETVKLT